MEFQVGGAVHVFKRERSKYNPVPEDGYQGIVTKVGRKYGTVVFRTSPNAGEQTLQFELDSGRQKDTGYGFGYDWYVRTPEQLVKDKRRKAAVMVLGAAGLSGERNTGFDRSFTLEQLEALAKVVKYDPVFVGTEGRYFVYPTRQGMFEVIDRDWGQPVFKGNEEQAREECDKRNGIDVDWQRTQEDIAEVDEKRTR